MKSSFDNERFLIKLENDGKTIIFASLLAKYT